MKKLLPLLVLVPFTLFSLQVTYQQGYFGFIALAGREPWALQMLLDLVIAFVLVATWIRKDAKERGLPSTPYVVATLLLGSIGALAYFVHRAFAGSRAPEHAT
jgi:protein-S-isoprenylcysteine O-methyltransferase Ste14